MKFRWQQLIPIVALGCALPAMAAREFTPQAGLWMIPSENNGQPGRGFSLDVQGNTAFLQVFSYEKSGAATFHTAVGKLDDAASMTVPLLRFKGGRSFGGPAQDAVEDGSAGNVTVKFTDGLNGSIQFPGESEQPIGRFLVPEQLPYWWAESAKAPEVKAFGSRSMKWTAVANDGTQYLWRAFLQTDLNGQLTMSIREVTGPLDYPSPTEYTCHLDISTQVVDCTETESVKIADPNDHGILHARFRSIGPDIVGELQPKGKSTERWVLNGFVDGSTRVTCAEPCAYLNDVTSWAYSTNGFPDGICIPEMCDYHYATMVLPTSGAWIISAENSGKPGRGVFLDVQENTVIVQTSDYLKSGDPTFHMGASHLIAPSYGGKDTTATVPLLQYGRGRYFGGPAQSGIEVANAGALGLTVAAWSDKSSTDFATGDIQLPGESTQQIRRLELETSNNPMDNKLGEYLLRWNTTQGKRSSWVRLTRLENNIAMSDDGLVQCYGATSQYPNQMRCALLPSPNLAQNWTGMADVRLNTFHRNEEGYDFIMRTRDQHGNWLGLGKVDLPGLAIPVDK